MGSELARALRYRYIAMFSFSVHPPQEAEVFEHLSRFLVRDHRVGDAAWIYRSDEARIELAAELGKPSCPSPLTRLSRGMNSTVGKCISVHEAILVRDCSNEPEYPPPLYPEPTVGSVMCAHLTADNVCYGAIWLYSAIPNCFENEDRVQLQTLATVAAFTISRIRLQDRLNWLANHDELTELPHRRGLRQFADAVEVREGERRAVLLVDIDNFKQYNTINHALGDQVIREVGLRLKGLVGPNGMVGRWSGDEFVAVISVATDFRQELNERVVDSMRAHPAAGQEVSISVGAAWWDTGDLEAAVRVADDGLRAAKDKGKGRAIMAD